MEIVLVGVVSRHRLCVSDGKLDGSSTTTRRQLDDHPTTTGGHTTTTTGSGSGLSQQGVYPDCSPRVEGSAVVQATGHCSSQTVTIGFFFNVRGLSDARGYGSCWTTLENMCRLTFRVYLRFFEKKKNGFVLLRMPLKKHASGIK